ncbi:uncharacterized protein LOC144124084 [Amblyomma americanum]
MPVHLHHLAPSVAGRSVSRPGARVGALASRAAEGTVVPAYMCRAARQMVGALNNAKVAQGLPTSLNSSPCFQGLAPAAWVLGMMVLGNYVQSSITAVRSTQTTFKNINSFSEMNHQIESGYIVQIDISQCYQKTSEGRHVALSVCTDNEVAVASQWGLVPGEHHLTMLQATAMHSLNPLRYQHRRLVLAVAEAGLAIPQRGMAVNRRGSHDGGQKEPLVLYCGVYILGCTLSCGAFVGELFMQSRLRRLIAMLHRRLLHRT